MPVCHQCGATPASEKFCGVCGVRQAQETSAVPPAESATPAPTTGPQDAAPPREERPTSMSVQRGTGELVEEHEPTGTSQGSSRRSKPKALEAGKVLNSRYEVVRRIGGGGMGAVYLAKDRNLGDAPRAVKEMI